MPQLTSARQRWTVDWQCENHNTTRPAARRRCKSPSALQRRLGLVQVLAAMQRPHDPALVIGIRFLQATRAKFFQPLIQRLGGFDGDPRGSRGGMAAHSGSERSFTKISISGTNNLPSRSVMSSTYITRRSQKARCANTMATVQCLPTGCCNPSSLRRAPGCESVGWKHDSVDERSIHAHCKPS